MNQNIKIIITGNKNIDKYKLAKLIESKNDNLSIAKKITSEQEYKDKESLIYEYMSLENIHLGYKNNAFVYIDTDNNYVSTGITLDSLYNNDIFVMNINEFNKISESVIAKNVFLVIWLDSKYHDESLYEDIAETKFLLSRLKSMDYIYFLDEDYNNIANIILKYLNNPDFRKEILEENS